ncbi:MAG: hypothetical protein SPF89_06370 [Sphaerochaetaceae bacterium]|nr:hypothetical protein [Spirochaetales bacterium]MDY5499709.1 hypothetical protein [Sphaerochaetaceae bacterium]
MEDYSARLDKVNAAHALPVKDCWDLPIRIEHNCEILLRGKIREIIIILPIVHSQKRKAIKVAKIFEHVLSLSVLAGQEKMFFHSDQAETG